MERQLKAYFKEITAVHRRGDAREESFYPSLEGFLEAGAEQQDRSGIQVTTLPRPTEAGNPDFRVWNGTDRIVGYLEAKPPTEQNLDRVANSEQLKRYRETFPNLILTNFFEFRLYRDGQLVDQVQAGRPFVLTDIKHPPPVEKVDELNGLLETFFDFSLPKAYTAEELAVALARRTRFLRDIVHQQLEMEEASGEGDLRSFYHAFQRFLIGNLTPEAFADLYAQTITYGLFAARTRAENGFNRRVAYQHIPHTIGILRDVFRFISLEDPPTELEWVVDDIAEVLAVADVGEILARYYQEGKGSDPIIHFYETFLAEYDPGQRERRGVYYTPEPVVSYIVRSVHEILKDKFDRPDGLADRNVTLLDPAAGTMTFVAKAAQVAVDEFKEKYGEGGVAQFIKDHILQNFYAFELMMAPYAVGHMKMAFFLEELGYKMTEDDRFKFYLTNTLEMEEMEQSELPGMKSLSEESKLAAEVKKEKPILVILGNPPYSGISANMGEWITGLIDDYKYVDGEHFGERKHWLHDDYVKFLRFAQWKIEQTGQGIVAMITNHGFLDNPTFRGMRWNLLQSFDEINVFDLHGNSLKREETPDGGLDENVFDIRQGVAIGFFCRVGEAGNSSSNTVFRMDIWGVREHKEGKLESGSYKDTDWKRVEPQPPFFNFTLDDRGSKNYERFRQITQLYPEHLSGIVTARDAFVIDFEKDVLIRRMRSFLDPSLTDEMIKEAFSLSENYQWRVTEARDELRRAGDLEGLVRPIWYRPFDRRFILYHPSVVWRTRRRIMRHMEMEGNLGIATVRRTERGGFTHAFIFDDLMTHHSVSIKEVNHLFPAFLIPDSDSQLSIFEGQGQSDRIANVSAEAREKMVEAYRIDVSPLEVMSFTYSVLFSEAWRASYAGELGQDFPRIPITHNRDLFQVLAELGAELIDSHLLRSPKLDPPVARFHGKGEAKVARTKRQGFRYEPQQERVYINPDQYFAPVPLPLWEYQIGGYQVLHKWLKDRKERTLTLDEIQTYCRIVTALAKTIEIQEEIDALYPQVEENLLEIDLD